MDIRGPSTANQFHLSSSGADDGVYLESYGPSGLTLSTGIAFNGSQWIAKAPGWSTISAYGGGIQFLDGTSATVGSPVTFVPAQMALIGGNVGIGTTTPQHLLHVAGTIGAEEVIVSATGADYVFDPGYHLAPLTAVADYIKEHHHLPDIPSAPEVKEKGMGVGEMQAKLLAKVEELTLHMIQSEERNNRLEEENAQLKERLERLEAKK